MTDRDHFAAAALTGLLANEGDGPALSKQCEYAYRIADAMLRERESPGRDDSVSQNTAETMRTVTEPMPKEKRAEVSGGRPVEWGLPNADGDEIWATSLNKEAIERHCPTNQTLVPLYRHAQPPLADAEREAVRYMIAAGKFGQRDEALTEERAATLRGLLERMQ